MIMALLTIPISAMFFTACSSDDDDNGRGNTEIKGDYIATTDVKTATLRDNKGYLKGLITIYEEFNNKYTLSLSWGQMCLIPHIRTGGKWELNYDSHVQGAPYRNINIIDCGKLSSISDVTSKVEIIEHYHDDWPSAQPGHGYAACFLTENGTEEYLRIYISNYKLDGDGALESITVEYQLY